MPSSTSEPKASASAVAHSTSPPSWYSLALVSNCLTSLGWGVKPGG